jgi:hypothetical protein
MQAAIVKYQVATYSGEIQVTCNPDDDDDIIIAKAKRQLIRRSGPLPFGYQSFRVIERN